jgi:arylsulfatase A-like enzyme
LGRPNIILINCDDLGYGDPGCYGSETHSTPALDRLAAEGMRFTDFYMAAPICSPSRSAMMTGCYAERVGLETGAEIGVLRPGEPIGLNPDEITVAGILSDQGYATQIIGKWHCGDQPPFLPTNHGFDSYYGIPYSNDMGISRRHPEFPPLPLVRDGEVIQSQPDQAALTERYTEEAVRFIRENRSRPFFLYLAHMYVHVPIYAPERFLKQSRDGAYGAAVEHVDFCAAVLLHELEQLGLDRNTMVIFTSDNGAVDRPGSNAPLRGHKGTTWEGGMRVPCIVRWLEAVPAGSECSEIATAMDFLPTFARLAGVSPPTDRIIDGKDIGPLLRGEPGAASAYDAFYYYREGEMQAIRRGAWKLHLANGELYNLRKDIGETEDLAPEEPDVVKDLQGAAESGRRDLGDALTGAPGENRRPCGRVDDPVPLTRQDPNDPYMIAMYD